MSVRPLSAFPRETWRKFRVYYTGGFAPYQMVEAPNKTYARLFLGGELRPGCKITSIEEVAKCIPRK